MQQITEEFSTPAWDGNLQAQLNLAVRFLRNKIEKGLRAVVESPMSCLMFDDDDDDNLSFSRREDEYSVFISCEHMTRCIIDRRFFL